MSATRIETYLNTVSIWLLLGISITAWKIQKLFKSETNIGNKETWERSFHTTGNVWRDKGITTYILHMVFQK